jgi:CheY-like chemotaxis protein
MKLPTVLCVDDNPAIRELYEGLLGKNGYEVITTGSGWQALDVFQAIGSEIDAVILDCEMPEMDGFELAARLKHDNPTLPIVMVSSVDPALQEMCPFVDAAILKGAPMRHIMDRIELLLADTEGRTEPQPAGAPPM